MTQETDRELLELAAKAAGVELIPMQINNVTEQGDDRFIGYMTKTNGWPRGWFDPIKDDGDALRLAVKLKLNISIGKVSAWSGVDGCEPVQSIFEGDPYAATRRAITRAAAEIGRAM